jgi:predicted regulator of Ras-like GTPase activity (Roadblock/LC7/MglB family)
MFDFASTNVSTYWYAVLIAALLAAIALGFLVRFVLPALRLGRHFSAAVAALEDIRRERGDDLRARVAREAMTQPAFAHIWEEYAQTLHPQPAAGGGVRWRATALADTFFTDQALVDTPLKTEYYKHLPGILTGLGIIGTFTGLIIGLSQFDVSLEPGLAQAQLRALINAVGHAFVVSAIAITLAMLFTWVEKSLVTSRYRQVEQLRQLIDGLFDVGADVEYLERLVHAAEAARSEAREDRAALVGELRAVLGEIAERQIDATARHHERLTQDLGALLAARLGQPIADIASAVNSVAARQDETVTRMIGEVLAGFSTQMQNLFAGQVRETHELLVATNAAMRATAGEFSAMAGRLDATGREAVDAMSAQLRQTTVEAETRQQAMQRQVGEQVERMSTTLAALQAQTADRIDRMLTQLGGELGSAVGDIQAQTRSATQAQQEQAERMAQATDTSFAGFSAQIERLAVLTVALQQSMQETLAGLSGATREAIDGMGAGADKLATAAHDFAVAGAGVSEVMTAATAVTERINQAADVLATASAGTRQLLDDQANVNAVFATLVGDLRDTVAIARRDASLSAELVDRLQAAAERLGTAQKRADDYLHGVTRVLEQAHQAFADNIERTLRESNRQFQSELARAVGLLSGAVEDLGQTVENIAAKEA